MFWPGQVLTNAELTAEWAWAICYLSVNSNYRYAYLDSFSRYSIVNSIVTDNGELSIGLAMFFKWNRDSKPVGMVFWATVTRHGAGMRWSSLYRCTYSIDVNTAWDKIVSSFSSFKYLSLLYFRLLRPLIIHTCFISTIQYYTQSSLSVGYRVQTAFTHFTAVFSYFSCLSSFFRR